MKLPPDKGEMKGVLIENPPFPPLSGRGLSGRKLNSSPDKGRLGGVIEIRN